MGLALLSVTTGSILLYALNKFLSPDLTSLPPIEEHRYTNDFNIPDYPICVVGAGITGLNIANILQEKGFEVHVFEKKSSVGGKAVTFRVGDEIQVEMGPVVVLPNTTLTNKIRELGLTLLRVNESDRLRFDPHSGKIFPLASITNEQRMNFMKAVRSYIEYRSGYSRELEFGYLNASPDLFVSTWEWLSVRNLQILRPFFSLVITSQGYGALEDVPALYVLREVTKELITNFATNSGTFFRIKEGFDVLFDKMAMNLSIHLNSEVFHIEREKEHQVLFYIVNEAPLRTYKAIKCFKVILAFPPLLSNLKHILSDLSQKEKLIFEQVKIHKYATAANYMPPLNNFLYFEDDLVPNDFNIQVGTGEVILFVRQSHLKLQNIYSSYSWIRGEYPTTPSVEERANMTTQLEATVKRMSQPGTILYQEEATDYFPHVTSTSLRQGFYKSFDSIQGEGGLYYATTLLAFETLTISLEMTEYFTQRYFS